MHRLGVLILIAAMVAGCGGNRDVDAVFAKYAEDAQAVTYDPASVPQGARVHVKSASVGGTVEVTAEFSGLPPSRSYGAHLHAGRCGPTGADAGLHYQHQRDPGATQQSPSTDAGYANGRNEIWLDFDTDQTGTGRASTVHDWPFDTKDPPRSLILHRERTKTAHGQAGTAGARLACVNLP